MFACFDQVDARIEELRNTACRQDAWRVPVARALAAAQAAPPLAASPLPKGRAQLIVAGPNQTAAPAAPAKALVPVAVVALLSTVPEVQRVEEALRAAVALCQRHSKLARQDTEAEQLWFTLLNRVVAWWRQVVAPAAAVVGTPSTSGSAAQSSPAAKANANAMLASAHANATPDMFELCLFGFLQSVLAELLGGVSLESLIRKISVEHPQDSLRAFRQTLRVRCARVVGCCVCHFCFWSR